MIRMAERTEKYAQDHLGNVNREIDDVRGQSGMDEQSGLTEIEEGEEGTPKVVMEVPYDVQNAYIYQIDAYNASEQDSHFRLHEAELDNQGNIIHTSRRSVRHTVAEETSRTISYTGDGFSSDAIVVTSEFEGDIGVGVYLDSREEHEPTTEQRNSLE